MLKKISYLITVLSLLIVPALSLGYVSADASQDSVCKGIGLVSNTDGNGCAEDPSSPSVNSTIHAVVTILSFIVGAGPTRQKNGVEKQI